MDNFAIRSALVTQQSSKTLFGTSIDFAQIIGERGDSTSNWLTSINLDKRNVAVGGLNTYWVYELIKKMEPEWAAIIESEYIAQEQVLMSKRPSSILFFDADNLLWNIYRNRYPETELCFVNNHTLFIMESVTNSLEHPGVRIDDNSEYDVIDASDLGVDKFDMAVCWAWSIVGSEDALSGLINSLNPGGVLLIGMSNHNTKLYREDFHIHPYSQMHEILKNSDGHTYHLANGYGQTVFVKN